MLQQAVAYHQIGRLFDAEKIYLDILQARPDHPEANHNLGVLAVQRNQATNSLPYFMAALESDPTRGQYWLSYVDGLFQAGQLEAARDVLNLARQNGLQGDDIDAMDLRLKDEVSVAEKPDELQSTFAESKHATRRLHIGGNEKSDGWEILNAVPAPYVDHVCNANDLSMFSDNTFIEIYASHVVEHLDYKDEILATLKEWNRVLEPGGRLLVSVPNLDVLAKFFLDKENLTAEDRFYVMRMIFGGHLDKFDYHVVGLNEEFLTAYLSGAGYVNIRTVNAGRLGSFNDGSAMLFQGVPISLNMIAEKSDQY